MPTISTISTIITNNIASLEANLPDFFSISLFYGSDIPKKRAESEFGDYRLKNQELKKNAFHIALEEDGKTVASTNLFVICDEALDEIIYWQNKESDIPLKMEQATLRDVIPAHFKEAVLLGFTLNTHSTTSPCYTFFKGITEIASLKDCLFITEPEGLLFVNNLIDENGKIKRIPFMNLPEKALGNVGKNTPESNVTRKLCQNLGLQLQSEHYNELRYSPVYSSHPFKVQ